MNAIGALCKGSCTYVRISDNERRAARRRKRQAERRERKTTPRSPSRTLSSVRKCLINGQQSVSLFKRAAMTDSHLQAGGTSADRGQWDERSRKKIGGDIRTDVRAFVRLNGLRPSNISYAISSAGFSSKPVSFAISCDFFSPSLLAPLPLG